ncbi:MAG: hypothetical protein NTZ01_01265 [Verrucomicrobia bacterium]|nr:hypothetical protein [Verrucomicrobiota bacterium]
MTSIKLNLSDQVREFTSQLAPETRSRFRSALREFQRGNTGDCKQLEDNLEGYYRLRIGHFRVIYAYQTRRNRLEADLLMMAPRKIIYQAFAHVASLLAGKFVEKESEEKERFYVSTKPRKRS